MSSGCGRPWQKSPLGAPNMVFVWYGANVMLRISTSRKLGAYLVILSMTTSAICSQVAMRGASVEKA